MVGMNNKNIKEGIVNNRFQLDILDLFSKYQGNRTMDNFNSLIYDEVYKQFINIWLQLKQYNTFIVCDKTEMLGDLEDNNKSKIEYVFNNLTSINPRTLIKDSGFNEISLKYGETLYCFKCNDYDEFVSLKNRFNVVETYNYLLYTTLKSE